VKFTRVELRDFAIGTKAIKPEYSDKKEAQKLRY